MAAGPRHGVDHLPTEFVGKLRKLGLGETAKVRRKVDGIEQRSLGSF
tara:strand:- start:173 stop:313 length:141 start_codon:yes stop_codon:yes gene_type:complete